MIRVMVPYSQMETNVGRVWETSIRVHKVEVTVKTAIYPIQVVQKRMVTAEILIASVMMRRMEF